MLYLSGAKNRLMSDDLAAGRVGLLQTPAAAYRLDDVAVWAMDNGCFTDTYPGDDAYLATLDKYAHHQARCLAGNWRSRGNARERQMGQRDARAGRRF